MKKRNVIIVALLIAITLFLCILNKNNILSFFDSCYNSFYRTLIEENRYVLMINGLKATILISTFSIVIGMMLGGIICYFRKSKFDIFKFIAKTIIAILQGMPITVLLLIFYYVVFGNINCNPIIVAVITFSIYFSAYVAEIYRGSIEAINKNQIEAAYSLGFSKGQTLYYIVLPQILSYAIPSFKNECVSLIKLTSIAGYISIMDLTKASDIIRNRTYEAFFPLIITAFIYFVICFIVGKLLDCLYKKINHRQSLKSI